MKVSDYIEILKIKRERFDNELDRSCAMLSVYLDEDIETIEERPIIEAQRLIYEMNDFLNKSYPVLDCVPNDKILLENFIDLESYLQSPDDLGKCIAILFRNKMLNEWGHTIYEPVEFDLTDRSESLMDNDITLYLGGLNDYINFRQSVVDTYKSIFGLDEEETEIETDGLTENEIKEIEEDEKKREAKAKYSWENFVYWLAGEDLTKVDSVMKFPILYALNMASMKKVYES